MKSLRFVAAFPRHGSLDRAASLDRADRPDQVCAGGAQFWTTEDVPMIDLGNAGRIWGILFLKVSTALLNRLPAEAPVDDGPEALASWLVRECWGGYVAVLTDRVSGTFEIMVDPSGLFPIYRTETLTHAVIASHPDLLCKGSKLIPTVSWQALRLHLYRPELRQRSTCLADIDELRPGELAPATKQALQAKRLWRPDAFMPGNTSISFDEAAEELSALAVQVIGAWANILGPVAVAASGGVDSSFICAALKRRGESFTCVTVATADPSGDERQFVRILSERLDMHTIDAIYDPAMIDPLRAVSNGMARPTRKAFMAALDAALLEAGASIGANAIFDGNGGDNLFCFLHSSAPIVDRLRCDGIAHGTFSTFLDMCRLTGCDIPTMSRAVLRRLMKQIRFPDPPADTRLIEIPPDVAIRFEPLTPWLDTEVGRHGGKRDHLALIMQAQNHSHGLASNGLPRFSPLMSQPLVEFCLGIPTWRWCEGGINRALARAAFAADLPREILTRTSKSGPDSFIRRSFDDHRSTISDLLLGGLLIQHGIVDRAAVESVLGADILSSDSIIYRLLDLAETENWARSWTG